MRTALCMAIGLAFVVGGVPASFAQDSRVQDHGKPAGTGIEAKERSAHRRPRSGTGISLVVPIGRISVERGSVGGEPVYVRRTTAREGMTIVEVSTTPFMPVLAGVAQLVARPDQPASW